MNRVTLFLSALILGIATSVASATPITGSISITGHDTFDSTGITFTPSTGTISGATGSFTAYAPVSLGGGEFQYSVDLTSFLYSGASNTTVFTTLDDLLSFTITSLTTTTFDGSIPSLVLKGTGIFQESGFDNTAATFTLTSSSSGLTSFELDSTAVTPEPGSIVLLGTGLAGLGIFSLLRRRTDGFVS